MSIFGRWDSWWDPICRVETIILFFNTRIYSRLDWSPCLQINVMQVERKENAGIMKYGIRDSWSTQEQRQSFDCDIIDMLHISCFHISVAAAARCRCRRVTPRRTFSHQNIQGQCLLPASITVVADTGHWSHTWGSGHSKVTLVTQDGGGVTVTGMPSAPAASSPDTQLRSSSCHHSPPTQAVVCTRTWGQNRRLCRYIYYIALSLHVLI